MVDTEVGGSAPVVEGWWAGSSLAKDTNPSSLYVYVCCDRTVGSAQEVTTRTTASVSTCECMCVLRAVI